MFKGVSCGECSACDRVSGISEAVNVRRYMDTTHGWTGGAQGPRQHKRTTGARDASPTEQQMAEPIEPAGSSNSGEIIDVLGSSLV